jgi:hypothetical protein
VALKDSLFVDLILAQNNDGGAAVHASGISDAFSLTSSVFIGCHSDHKSLSGLTIWGAVSAIARWFSVESCCGVDCRATIGQFLYLCRISGSATSIVRFMNTLSCGG